MHEDSRSIATHRRGCSLLAGCTVGPNYRRPAVTPPDVFRGSADAPQPTLRRWRT